MNAPRAGLVDRIVFAWRDPAASFTAERGAGEPRLLAYAFGAAAFVTLGRLAAEAIAGAPAAEIDAMGRIAVVIFAGFSFLPLALYAVAAVIGAASRACGGTGGWAATRLAFFWSGLAAGPATVAGYALGGALGGAAAASAAGGLVWAVLFAPMLAGAHGFAARRVYAAFAASAVLAFAMRAFG